MQSLPDISSRGRLAPGGKVLCDRPMQEFIWCEVLNYV